MSWKVPDGSLDPLMINLGKILEQEQAVAPGLFPDLRGDQELVIASDYSGEHQNSSHSVFAYLLTDMSSLQAWEGERLAIRRELLPDGRRMAFKNLADSKRQMAFHSFLQATGKLNGIVFLLALDKRAGKWEVPEGFLGLDDIKPGVREKMINVFLYGSFLVAGLSRFGQVIRWITDDDEIVSNETTQQAASRVMGNMLATRCTHGLAGGVLGVASKFEDGRRAEDLCAVPDLLAGAFSEFLSDAPEGTINEAGLHVPKATMYSTKTILLLAWLSTLSGPLKKVCCHVFPNSENGRGYRFLSISTWIDQGGGTLWTPPDKGWKQAMEGWSRGGGREV